MVQGKTDCPGEEKIGVTWWLFSNLWEELLFGKRIGLVSTSGWKPRDILFTVLGSNWKKIGLLIKLYIFYYCSDLGVFWITAQCIGTVEYRVKVRFLTFYILKYYCYGERKQTYRIFNISCSYILIAPHIFRCHISIQPGCIIHSELTFLWLGYIENISIGS